MLPARDQSKFLGDRAALEAEVERIVMAAEAGGLTVRALGSIGVAMHCPDAATLLPSFGRTYADIDLAAYRREARDLVTVLRQLGYLESRDVFINSEGSRSILDDPRRQIHLDVFYDRLEFCHVIPLDGRLAADRPTIPLTELLMSKLQIVKINEKDVVDAILLLLDHDLAAGDSGVIDGDRIAAVCAADWGWWRTLTMNLDKLVSLASTYAQLDQPQRARVLASTSALRARIAAEPKTLAWRMRARIGERRQWWTDVDEVT
ncbi:MAG: hypothetical protein ACRDF7_06145 [Candidatus Limnocylindrales bacterium]